MESFLLGKHSYSNGIRRGNANKISIGNYSSIAQDVIFDSGFNHDSTLITTFPLHLIWSDFNSNIKIQGRNIEIGSDVWIGERAVIFSGVKIGDGAIIGFGSIITKDVEPYSVVVGANRVVRKRFSDEQISELLKIKWWDWSDEKVKQNAELMLTNNIEEFINKHKI